MHFFLFLLGPQFLVQMLLTSNPGIGGELPSPIKERINTKKKKKIVRSDRDLLIIWASLWNI